MRGEKQGWAEGDWRRKRRRLLPRRRLLWVAVVSGKKPQWAWADLWKCLELGVCVRGSANRAYDLLGEDTCEEVTPRFWLAWRRRRRRVGGARECGVRGGLKLG